MALDFGAARTGVAVSDPTGIIARPLCVVQRAASANGLAELVACVRGGQGSLDELVERVTTTMLGRTEGRDDATLLAVRFVS